MDQQAEEDDVVDFSARQSWRSISISESIPPPAIYSTSCTQTAYEINKIKKRLQQLNMVKMTCWLQGRKELHVAVSGRWTNRLKKMALWILVRGNHEDWHLSPRVFHHLPYIALLALKQLMKLIRLRKVCNSWVWSKSPVDLKVV